MNLRCLQLSRTVRGLLGTTLLSALGTLPLLAEVPELAVQAGLAAATPSGEPRAETDWGLIRLSWGDRFQLRGEIPWLRLEGENAAAPGGIGPVSPTAPRRSRPGSGPDSPPGPGAGGGPSPLMAGSDSDAVDVETEPEPPPGAVSGLGDLRLAAAVRLTGGGSHQHRIDLGFSVKLPTADEDEGLGTGEADCRASLSGEYRFWSLTLFGGAGYNRLGDPPGVELDDVFDAYIGVESVPLGDRVLISGWIEGHPEIEAGVGDRVALGVGLRTLGKVRFELLGTLGLTRGAEDFAVSAGVAFGLRPPVAGPSGRRR